MSSTIRGSYDLVVIGGGIIGLGTARQVSMRNPKLRICVLEKEKELASHQSKRNSGVVHAGIYYKKGSLKSRFCIKGAKLIKNYCLTKKLAYQQCGKLIVATKEHELDTLHKLFQGAKANKIEGIELLKPEQIQNVQPGCTNALEAIWSPNTAIVDWQKVAHSFAEDFMQNNGHIMSDFTAFEFHPAKRGRINIEDAKTGEFVQTKAIVNCAGLYSDYFARRTGNDEHPKVIPFRGNYHILSDKVSKSIKTNIYPVPNPKFPFLGVHLTPRLDKSVIVGPTALLVSSYERYTSVDDIRLLEMYHIFVRSGLFKFLKKKDSIKAGLMELWRHNSRRKFAKEVSELFPNIKPDDLINTDFSGIRAQVVDKDGNIVDDFIFERGHKPQFQSVLHVRNCPSPAATSSLAISERIANILDEQILN